MKALERAGDRTGGGEKGVVLGFRGFSLRGKEKVTGEWELVCLSYNMERLHTLTQGVVS